MIICRQIYFVEVVAKANNIELYFLVMQSALELHHPVILTSCAQWSNGTHWSSLCWWCFLLSPLKNDASRYHLVYCIQRKSDTLACLRKAVPQILRDTSQTVKVLRTNGGGEFVNKNASKFYTEALIRHEIPTLYNPELNGVVEREN